jgi:hypothetical protein
MATENRNTCTDVKHELSSLRSELEVIDTWNRMFEASELNADSYLARQRRRWEIALRIKQLEKQSRIATYRPLPL